MTTELGRDFRPLVRALQFLVVAYVRAGAVSAAAALLAGLFAVWVGCYLLGGSHTAVPHLFYVPIVLAGVRFSWVGGAIAAAVAGLFAGPALPVDTSTGEAQPLEGWLLRLAMFLVVGILVGALMRGRSETIKATFQDARLSAQLLEGLRRGEIEVHYQPIYSCQRQNVTGFEALARWRHPRRGPVTPAEFVPAAERTGAVAALDSYVLRHAASQAARWTADLGQMTISVNISATRFAQGDLAEEVARVLVETGLLSQSLQLEITESAVIEDFPSARRQMARLRDMGVRIAIDDFGIGQAALAYLNEMRVDTVKIDRSLVADIVSSPDAGRLVTGLVRLFQTLSLEVVIEGVESREQYDFLMAAEAGFLQGYFLGRPMCAEDAAAQLSRLSR